MTSHSVCFSKRGISWIERDKSPLFIFLFGSRRTDVVGKYIIFTEKNKVYPIHMVHSHMEIDKYLRTSGFSV